MILHFIFFILWGMVYLGADHGGFHLKEQIHSWLLEWGVPYEDCGAYALDPDDDYPDFAFAVADKVVQNPENRGILLCRSGSGMVIAANKVKGVRASLVYNEQSAHHARSNDDANIAALAGDWVREEDAKKILKIFLETPFSREERHYRRVQKVTLAE